MGRRTGALALILAAALALGACPARADGEQTVLAENDSVYAAVTGYDPAGAWGPAFTLHLENRTGQTLRFALTMVSADGRMCDVPWSTSVLAGEQADSQMIWDRDALDRAGVNYISHAEAVLWVYDAGSRQDVLRVPVGWTAPTEGADGPAVEERVFDGGLERTALLEGELSAEAVDYDPAGGADGGPALTLYLENGSDQDAYFTAADVTVDGVPCDPWWGQLVGAGKTAYSVVQWQPEALESAGAETPATVGLRLEATDLLGGTLAAAEEPAVLTVGEPGTHEPAPSPEPTEEPAWPEADPAVYGVVEDGVYRNDYFGLTCTLPWGWEFYSDQELARMESAAIESLQGTDMEPYADAFTASGLNHYVMAAYSADGMRSVNAEVTYLDGMDRQMTADQLLDAALAQMDLGEDGDLSALGWEGAVMEKTQCIFAGAQTPALRVEYTDASLGIRIPVYLRLVYVLRDGYAMQITMSSLLSEGGTDQIAGFFHIAEDPA